MAAGFPGSSEMRVGHDEREAVAAELREHYAQGRLTIDEMNERLDLAFAAKTRGDLDALMRDLPSQRPAPAAAQSGYNGSGAGPGAGAGSGAGQRAGQAIAAMLTGATVVIALFVLGMLGVFGIGASRPLGIVLIIVGLGFLRRLLFGRRHHHVRPRRPHRRW
jgi:hypothetical protein